MNTIDFTETYYIDRRGSHSRKWDGEHLKFSRTDLLPLWVADMDFMPPQCIQEAICNYVKANPLGYTMTNPDYISAVMNWHKRRHNCNLEQDWLTSAPNVITGIMWCIGAFTKPNDVIAVLSPVYGAFDTSASDAQRQIIAIPMKRSDDNRYTVDYEAFETAITKHDVKLFIHCNPHNPVGHVWTENEMDRLFSICERHKVLIISDEIHQDLITGPTPFTPTLSVCNGVYKDNIIAMSSVSKSFNMASLHQAEVIIPNEGLRNQYTAYKAQVYHTDADVIAETAIAAAYTHPEAEAWLTDVLAVIRENYDYLCNELLSVLPELRISPMDGTYLAWIDFGAYVKAEDMHDLFENKCRIAPSFGEWFGGESYATFVRLNLATSLANIKIATNTIIQYIHP
ncbi:MAG: aminotransferase class I/II-fold pyridoxal phosphate-dependent enzyme [Veillonella sp.]|uniref:MalY/PatB family protein n=1 Tax=Veillonella sp. TaxID=1926307 RepID=UPI00290998EB|nr:aminotransferase class I/II-fold pyridoxal phosphate-dependent enzyme [Veillonella sp.]MDU3514741.1 aminotransferase class I/II-fold pyridoxal phosphate-dependent enzyme [Veillonella sp.]MDU6768508.1 aminotransferase class I/II-fold pyridoxal phosphate-dependent enzyme [Veillonella sp.]